MTIAATALVGSLALLGVALYYEIHVRAEF